LQAGFIARYFTRERFALLGDTFAAGVAIALPWSTSLTVMLTWLYLLMLLPTREVAALPREFLRRVSALPTALFLLAGVGTLWADVPIGERLQGLSAFRLVLIIPALIVHFRHSANAHWVLVGFLASCTALLALSWALFLFPRIPWYRSMEVFDVPVKDHISQSAEFTICIFALAAIASDAWRARRHWFAAALIVLALAFLGNILYVATARTALVVLPVLLVVWGFKEFGKRGLLGLLIAGAALAAFAWVSSPHLRGSVNRIAAEVQSYLCYVNRPVGFPEERMPGLAEDMAYHHCTLKTPIGWRLEFWRRSIELLAEAPLIGHGTGSIQLFRRAAIAEAVPAAPSINPHNQFLAVALQLGLLGVVVMLAMWLVHLALFCGPGLAAWIGLVVVVQNVITSMFNSHLFDFTHGVGYGLGVGVAGALILRETSTPAPSDVTKRPSSSTACIAAGN
jgi:hypothetical protein